MSKSNESSNSDAAAKAAAEAEAKKKADAEQAAKAGAEAEAKNKLVAEVDDGLRPRRPAKVGKSIKVLSKGKTAQVVTDGVHVWKEAL